MSYGEDIRDIYFIKRNLIKILEILLIFKIGPIQIQNRFILIKVTIKLKINNVCFYLQKEIIKFSFSVNLHSFLDVQLNILVFRWKLAIFLKFRQLDSIFCKDCLIFLFYKTPFLWTFPPDRLYPVILFI